jgi:4-methyl-5(b-hydroxyethyl)-thiazole monophosphate biosynthesis
MSRVLVPIAEGSEELEAISVVDLLRRAGIDVVIAGPTEDPVVMSRHVVILPDASLEEALEQDFDMMVIPGGSPGTDNLDKDERVHTLLRKMSDSGKYVAAICAGPRVLAHAGLLDGKRATSYPGALDLSDRPAVKSTGSALEVDGKIITSRGPGTAMDFALKLVELLAGKEKRTEVEGRLQRS